MEPEVELEVVEVEEVVVVEVEEVELLVEVVAVV